MKTEQSSVTLKVGTAPDEKEFTRAYTKVTYETAADVVEAMQNPDGLKAIIGALNYGLDLKLRAKVRQQLDSESAGPEKALEKMIKTLNAQRVALGKPELPYEVAKAKAIALQAAMAED